MDLNNTRHSLLNCRVNPGHDCRSAGQSTELHDVVVVLPSTWSVPLEAHGHAYVMFELHRCLQAAPKPTKSCQQQHFIIDSIRGHGELHPKAKKEAAKDAIFWTARGVVAIVHLQLHD